MTDHKEFRSAEFILGLEICVLLCTYNIVTMVVYVTVLGNHF